MSRDVSSQFRENAYNQTDTDGILVLITIDHTDLTSPIRIVNNNESIVSNGNTFEPVAIKVTLPSEIEGQISNAKLSIDAVDRTIIYAVRSISSAPDITLEIVKISDYDTIEVSYDFQLRNINVKGSRVDGDLIFQTYTREKISSLEYTTVNTPGLYDL